MSALITVSEYENFNYGEDQGEKKTYNEYPADTNAIADMEYMKIVRMYMDTMASESHDNRFTCRSHHGNDWASVAMYVDADKHYVHISVTFNI